MIVWSESDASVVAGVWTPSLEKRTPLSAGGINSGDRSIRPNVNALNSGDRGIPPIGAHTLHAAGETNLRSSRLLWQWANKTTPLSVDVAKRKIT